MCTVTFLPISENRAEKPEFILTSNRDEKLARPAAIHPQKYELDKDRKLYFPKDPVGEGSWIALDSQLRVACLLNGGLESHVSNPPYKHSRGKIVLDSFSFADCNKFIEQYEFDGIEPFTLILATFNSLNEVRWNGTRLFHSSLNSSIPHIWSSVTLYSAETIQLREYWFKKFLRENTAIDSKAILDFHRFGGDGDVKNDLKMDRDFLKTVSITSIHINSNGSKLQYEDLQNRTITSLDLALEKSL